MRLALIGKDVSKSKSKFIHENLLDCKYDLISCDNVGDVVEKLKSDYDGFNVTIPHKESVLEYLDEIDETCKKVLSCNTVLNVNGKLKGYNTDIYGFKKLIRDIKVNQERVLVLGAGGASKAVLSVLSELGAEIYVCNRTEERARAVINALKIQAKTIALNTALQEKFFAVINTTSVGMWDDNNPYVISRENCPEYAVDIICKETKFLKVASKLGAKTIRGETMLVYQAAAADEVYSGKRLDEIYVDRVIKELV